MHLLCHFDNLNRFKCETFLHLNDYIDGIRLFVVFKSLLPFSVQFLERRSGVNRQKSHRCEPPWKHNGATACSANSNIHSFAQQLDGLCHYIGEYFRASRGLSRGERGVQYDEKLPVQYNMQCEDLDRDVDFIVMTDIKNCCPAIMYSYINGLVCSGHSLRVILKYFILIHFFCRILFILFIYRPDIQQWTTLCMTTSITRQVRKM